MEQSEMKLDGNAIARPLARDLHDGDDHGGARTCAGCGKVHAVGRVDVYMNAPGVVVRCPACEQVLMRIVHGRGRYWIDLRGTRCLEFASPA